MISMVLLYILLPVGLVIAAGELIRRRGNPETASRRHFLFLVWTALGILALILALPWILPPNGRGFSVSFAPVIAGVVVLILLRWQEWKNLQGRAKKVIVITLLFLIALFLLQFIFNRMKSDGGNLDAILFLSAIFVVSMTVSLMWLLGKRHPFVVTGMSLLYMLLFNVLEGGAQPLLSESPGAWLTIVSALYYLLLPSLVITGVAVLTSFALVGSSTSDDSMFSWRSSGIAWGAVIALLGGLSYTITWLCIWDGTDDGIRGIMMIMLSILTAVAGGMVLFTSIKNWKRWSGLVFAGVVIGLVYWTVMVPGNRFRPYDITEKRALSIQSAVEDFRSKTGAYPETLSELVPEMLLRIPLPMIIPRMDWCYQGGADHYRLGVVYREHWSSPDLSIRVYASAGTAPAAAWNCDEKLAEMLAQREMQSDLPSNVEPLPTSVVSKDRTSVDPIFRAKNISVGNWSLDGSYLVFGQNESSTDPDAPVTINLQFLNAETGEICQSAGGAWKAGSRSDGLYEHYAWLPDGRFLYVSEAGDVVAIRPCSDVLENLSDRYPVEFTNAVSYDETSGSTLLKNKESYWLLNGHNLEVHKINDVVPSASDDQSDRYAWLPGGERLMISQLNGQAAEDGVTVFSIDATTGVVERRLLLANTSEQMDSPLVDGLTRDKVLIQYSDSLTIMNLRSDPPTTTDVVRDIFLLDLSYPIDFSSMDYVRLPDEDGYVIGVGVNHLRNQDAYVYDSRSGDVSVLQYDASAVIFFPNGQWMRIIKLEDVPSYKDEFELVWWERSNEARRLHVDGHTPRNQPQLLPQYLPDSSQLIFNSSQGISLVSIADGETVRFWELLGSNGATGRVIPTPSGKAIIATVDGVGLYYIPLLPAE